MFKILIAEDDRELRQLFQHVLIKNGYAVTGVSNGEEAMDAIEAQKWTEANKCLKTITRNAKGSEDAQLLQVKDDAEWLQAVVSMKRGRYFTAKRQLKAIANSNSTHAEQAQTALDSLK